MDRAWLCFVDLLPWQQAHCISQTFSDYFSSLIFLYCMFKCASVFFLCRHFSTFTQSSWKECVPLSATRTLIGFLLTLVRVVEWHVNGFGLIKTKNCYFNASENNIWVCACMHAHSDHAVSKSVRADNTDDVSVLSLRSSQKLSIAWSRPDPLDFRLRWTPWWFYSPSMQHAIQSSK